MNDFLNRELDPAFARRARIILENLDLKSGMNILDLGCGRGFYELALASLHKDFSLSAVDLNIDYLETAKKNLKQIKDIKERGISIRFIKADATRLPFKDNTFDRIICSEVLEHIPDDQQVIKEMKRVLKKGGYAFLTVPNKNYPFFWDPLNFILERLFQWHIPSNIWWLAGIWADHVRLYTEGELTVKIKESGLGIGHIWRTTHYCLPFSHFLLYGIGKNLVEKGLIGGGFDRFDFIQATSALHKLVHSIFYSVDRFNSEHVAFRSFVNIIIKMQK